MEDARIGFGDGNGDRAEMISHQEGFLEMRWLICRSYRRVSEAPVGTDARLRGNGLTATRRWLHAWPPYRFCKRQAVIRRGSRLSGISSAVTPIHA
jgi:hypothetical protein